MPRGLWIPLLDWFDSGLIVALAVIAACTLTGFVIREITAAEPILDLTVFNDRNFAFGTVAMFLVGLGFNSSVLLVALYTQKILGYDAWTSGLTLAPGSLRPRVGGGSRSSCAPL